MADKSRNKPFRIWIELAPDVHEKLVKEADANKRTLRSHCEFIIESNAKCPEAQQAHTKPA